MAAEEEKVRDLSPKRVPKPKRVRERSPEYKKTTDDLEKEDAVIKGRKVANVGPSDKERRKMRTDRYNKLTEAMIMKPKAAKPEVKPTAPVPEAEESEYAKTLRTAQQRLQTFQKKVHAPPHPPPPEHCTGTPEL